MLLVYLVLNNEILPYIDKIIFLTGFQFTIMHYQEYTPSLHLRPFIEKFWTLESNDSDTYPMEHLLTPNGSEDLNLIKIPTRSSKVYTK